MKESNRIGKRFWKNINFTDRAASAAQAAANAAKENKKIAENEAPDSAETPADGGTHLSKSELKEQAKRQREAEKARRRAEKKAREEFKKGLEDIDSERNENDVLAAQTYRTGFASWQEYQQMLHDDEIAMLKAKMKYYEDNGMEDDEDYSEFAKKIQEKEIVFATKNRKLTLEEQKISRKREENEVELRYATPDSDIFRNEEGRLSALHEIRIRYMEMERNLYAETSEEWRQKNLKIEDAENEEKLRKQKVFVTQMEQYSLEYSGKTRKEKMNEELKVLEALKKREILTEEEYQKAVKDLRRKYGDDSKESAVKISSEYADMIKNLWTALSDLFKVTSEDFANNGEGFMGKVAAAAQAAFALMSAALQSYSQYAQAQTEYETAVISRNYDRRIEMANGNNARQKRLEEQKEKAVSRVKAKAAESNFALKVATAIAQTASNAIMAYAAGLSIGGIQGLILAPIAAAMATAAGAVQIATIKKQRDTAVVQGYSEGGFTKRGEKYEPAGIVHAGEWVASQKLVNNPQTRPLIDMLEYAQRINTIPTITPEDVSRRISAPMATAERIESASQSGMDAAGNAIAEIISSPRTQSDESLADAIARLNRVLSNPITARVTISGSNGVDQETRKYNQLLKNKKI